MVQTANVDIFRVFVCYTQKKNTYSDLSKVRNLIDILLKNMV